MAWGFQPLQQAYICLFALTAIGCFSIIPRARSRLDDPETRWGLVTLLALSGLWAAFHVGRLVAPISVLKITFYVLGLVVGLASVGAWLYFCSAYANETYHRQAVFRWTALAVYVAIISVKLTSPIHGLYFTTASSTTPFPHLIIQLGVAHWVVTGLSYALSAVGFYILFDLFQNSGHATTRLSYLVGLAGLPVVFDIISYTTQGWILTFNYEPIGVGLFAVGALYVADGTFVAVRVFGREQLVDELDDAILLVDRDHIVRDVNSAATRLFPALSGAIGEPLDSIAPDIAEYLRGDIPELVTRDDGDIARHYLLATPQLTAGQTTIGHAIVFTEITELERQRQQIQQQKSQLDDFAEAITHELRNTLNVLIGHLNLAHNEQTAEAPQAEVENLETAIRMTDRMERLIADLTTMAQFGQTADERYSVDIEEVAVQAFASVGGDRDALSVDAGTIQANKPRLERLFEKLFRFALLNGATRVAVNQTADGFTVTDDGSAVDEDQTEAAFKYGQAVPNAETGMLLPVTRTLAKAHGWDITIDPDYQRGIRIAVTT